MKPTQTDLVSNQTIHHDTKWQLFTPFIQNYIIQLTEVERRKKKKKSQQRAISSN